MCSSTKALAIMFFIFMMCMLINLPPIYACGTYCPPYHLPSPRIPTPPRSPVIIPPPHGGGGGGGGYVYPPPSIPPPQGGGGGTPSVLPTCPIDALKLGACVDVLGGLIHIGIGNPLENTCCPVLQGLLELEAAICLCTTIRLKLLNLNIFIPLALQVLITCGITPPPGFVCPPLV